MDITQEVFLLFQQKGDFLAKENIRSWLLSVADIKIKEEFRFRKKHSYIEYIEDIPPDSEELLTELNEIIITADSEIEASKAGILSKLSPEEQILFKMIYQEKLKYNEVAKLMNLSEKAVNLRAFRMRAKILKILQMSFIVALVVLTNFRRLF